MLRLKSSLILIILTINTLAFGQVLNNSKGQAFTDKPFFNEEFIRINKIKTIKGQFNYKKSRQAIIEQNYFYVYNFDENGKLTSTYETRKDDGTKDTTWNIYIYNDRNHLIEHQKGNAQGKTANLYIHDGEETIREEYWTESLDSTGRLNRLLFNAERIENSTYLNTKRKKYFNSYNLPYMEEVDTYDSLGYLVSTERRMTRTQNYLIKKYQYNDKGYLAVLNIFDNSKEPTETFEYEYDDFGNLTQTHYYKKGVFTTDTQIVYNAKSRLITSVIIREVLTDFIMILRYNEYDYY